MFICSKAESGPLLFHTSAQQGSGAFPPGSNLVAPALIFLTAPVDKHPARVMGQTDILVESVEEVGGNGLCGFDLHGDAPCAHVQHEIYLQSAGIPPEIEGWPLTVVQEELLDLVEDEVLKNGSPQGMDPHIFSLPYAQQVTEESAVHKIELGTLDETLGEIFIKRRQEIQHITGSQDGDPSSGLDVGHPAIGPEGGGVQKASHPTCAERQESGECVKIPNTCHLADIALHIGPHIPVKPSGCVQITVMDPREKTLEHGFVKVNAVRLLDGVGGLQEGLSGKGLAPA